MLPLAQGLLAIAAPRVPAVLRALSAVVYFACNLPWLLHYTTMLFLVLYGLCVASVVYLIMSSLASSRCRSNCSARMDKDGTKQGSHANFPAITTARKYKVQSPMDCGGKRTKAETDWRRALLREVAERNRQFRERKLQDPSMPTHDAHLRPVSLRRVN